MTEEKKGRYKDMDDGELEGALIKVAPREPAGTGNQLKALIQSPGVIEAIQDIIPNHLTPKFITKAVLMAASRNPFLLKCTQLSLIKSAMEAGKLGLDCSGLLGSAYLVPYWNKHISGYECQFMAGYRGLIDLARRSGGVRRIEAQVVYENDDFEFVLGDSPHVMHRPCLRGKRGGIVAAYAVAILGNADIQVEIMTLAELEGIKARSKSRDKGGNLVGPWVTDTNEMYRKTVVRRLTKYLPLSPDLAEALKVDRDFDEGALPHTAIASIQPTGGERRSLKQVFQPEHIAEEPETIDATIDEGGTDDGLLPRDDSFEPWGTEEGKSNA